MSVPNVTYARGGWWVGIVRRGVDFPSLYVHASDTLDGREQDHCFETIA